MDFLTGSSALEVKFKEAPDKSDYNNLVLFSQNYERKAYLVNLGLKENNALPVFLLEKV